MRAFRRGTFSRACSHFHTSHRSPRVYRGYAPENRIHTQSTRRADLLIIKKVRELAHATNYQRSFLIVARFQRADARIATGLGDMSRDERDVLLNGVSRQAFPGGGIFARPEIARAAVKSVSKQHC
jgi:hypothetical protein